MYIYNYDSLSKLLIKRKIMTKNNLKIVKSGKNQEAESKEKNKALEA